MKIIKFIIQFTLLIGILSLITPMGYFFNGYSFFIVPSILLFEILILIYLQQKELLKRIDNLNKKLDKKGDVIKY